MCDVCAMSAKKCAMIIGARFYVKNTEARKKASEVETVHYGIFPPTNLYLVFYLSHLAPLPQSKVVLPGKNSRKTHHPDEIINNPSGNSENHPHPNAFWNVHSTPVEWHFRHPRPNSLRMLIPVAVCIAQLIRVHPTGKSNMRFLVTGIRLSEY